MEGVASHSSNNEQIYFNDSTLTVLVTTVVLAAAYIAKQIVQDNEPKSQESPPCIPHTIPFLGHAVSFGKCPVEFLLAAYHKYGPVFTFKMMGKTFTYLIGSDAAAAFFNSKNEDLNAEEVYGKIVTPVFGKGVAYDVPNHIFLEQKKMLKSGLNIARFKLHIPLIEEETKAYFERWSESGESDLFKSLSELIILTASRCLHGKEIRSVLNEDVAQLYIDLDGGFSAEAWLLPAWVPLPSFKKRDEAHQKIRQIFRTAIKKRRDSGQIEEDMLQTLLETSYKSGRKMNDDEIAGMLIGLLMAGQHTSSASGSWLGCFIAQHPEVQKKLYDEQVKVFGEDLQNLDYDGLKECVYLDSCLKESLRLRPPLMTMMRMCKTPLKVAGYVIPPGHQVCVSPTANQSIPEVWQEFDKFKPERFLEKSVATSDEKFSYIPFGAGRHRCIGEIFAYVQMKTIWSMLIRSFTFELAGKEFPEVNLASMLHTPKNAIVKYKRRT